jgi:hypothetical protein
MNLSLIFLGQIVTFVFEHVKKIHTLMEGMKVKHKDIIIKLFVWIFQVKALMWYNNLDKME